MRGGAAVYTRAAHTDADAADMVVGCRAASWTEFYAHCSLFSCR